MCAYVRCLLLASLVIGRPVVVCAEVLLLDTFNNATDSNTYGETDHYGLNKELDQAYRQEGTNRNTAYTLGAGGFEIQVYNPDWGKKLFLFESTENPIWIALDRDFVRNVKLSVTVEPYVHDNTGSQWVAVGLRGAGNSPNNRNLSAATNVGAVLKIASNGAWAYYENGQPVAGLSGTVDAANAYEVVMEVTGDSLTAKIGEATLFSGRTVHGDAAGTHNYISIGGGGGTGALSFVDNLKVEKLPESVGSVPR